MTQHIFERGCHVLGNIHRLNMRAVEGAERRGALQAHEQPSVTRPRMCGKACGQSHKLQIVRVEAHLVRRLLRKVVHAVTAERPRRRTLAHICR